jgi:hypothetical protein
MPLADRDRPEWLLSVAIWNQALRTVAIARRSDGVIAQNAAVPLGRQ